jgi:hypothetical protein
MSPGKVLRRLAQLAPAALAANARTPTRCVMATRVGLDVLAHFGVAAVELPVRMKVVNEAWMKAERSGLPIHQAMLAGAWMVDVGAPDLHCGPSDWCGHLVIEVPGHGLLDLDFQAVHRPEKQIWVEPAALFEHWRRPAMVFVNPRGGTVWFQHTPENVDYRTGPDWSSERVRPLVDHLVRSIRKTTL